MKKFPQTFNDLVQNLAFIVTFGAIMAITVVPLLAFFAKIYWTEIRWIFNLW